MAQAIETGSKWTAKRVKGRKDVVTYTIAEVHNEHVHYLSPESRHRRTMHVDLFLATFIPSEV